MVMVIHGHELLPGYPDKTDYPPYWKFIDRENYIISSVYRVLILKITSYLAKSFNDLY